MSTCRQVQRRSGENEREPGPFLHAPDGDIDDDVGACSEPGLAAPDEVSDDATMHPASGGRDRGRVGQEVGRGQLLGEQPVEPGRVPAAHDERQSGSPST